MKAPCQECGERIEFDDEHSGRAVICPHCGKPTALAGEGSHNLPSCRECGHIVSVSAEKCPNCGAVFKRASVFGTTFKVVISLLVIFIILPLTVLLGILIIGIATPNFQRARERAINLTNGVAASPAVSVDLAKKEYIRNYVRLYDFSASYHDSALDGTIPGVEFKLKNTGDRALKEVKVTVYFKDRLGSIIYEEEYYPVLVTRYSNDQPLKPGYIWQQQKNHFLAAKKVPSEWQTGNATAEITSIEFMP